MCAPGRSWQSCKRIWNRAGAAKRGRCRCIQHLQRPLGAVKAQTSFLPSYMQPVENWAFGTEMRWERAVLCIAFAVEN